MDSLVKNLLASDFLLCSIYNMEFPLAIGGRGETMSYHVLELNVTHVNLFFSQEDDPPFDISLIQLI